MHTDELRAANALQRTSDAQKQGPESLRIPAKAKSGYDEAEQHAGLKANTLGV